MDMPYTLPDGVTLVGFVVLADDVEMTTIYTAFDAWVVAMANAPRTRTPWEALVRCHLPRWFDHNGMCEHTDHDRLVPVIVPVVNTDNWITFDN